MAKSKEEKQTQQSSEQKEREGAAAPEAERRTRAVVVAVVRDGQSVAQTEEFLSELEFLAETADIDTVCRFTQRLPQPSARLYVGPGKIEEIAAYCADNEIDVAIFDDELSPSQTRNIEKALPCRVMDRTRLILDIFMSRARTAYAKTQVELAHNEYMLPRLAGLWTHLERQRGGTGTRGGAGEREIETDRRIVRNRIAKLKEDLAKIDRQMAVQRSNRGSLVRVALVGYTNVGKSTLMNLISKSDVFAENKLFATLDTTVRKVVFDNLPFLLSDTVGFIRKLPTELIESFKSTLDEVREADLLVHVVDISHPNFEEQIDVVGRELPERGVDAGRGALVARIRNPDLRDEKQILARNARSLYGSADARFVVVGLRGVDHAVARVERFARRGFGDERTARAARIGAEHQKVARFEMRLEIGEMVRQVRHRRRTVVNSNVHLELHDWFLKNVVCLHSAFSSAEISSFIFTACAAARLRTASRSS